MNDLFNRKDILTIATADQAVVGTKGFFGDSVLDLVKKIDRNDERELISVNIDETYCFESSGLAYLFFLPKDKVKEKVKEPVYRPIKTIDELFSFLLPSISEDKYNTLDKVGIISRTVFELKDKLSGYTYYKKFTCIRVSDYDIKLDACTLEFYFNTFEIKKDGEFVPFGIKEK